MTVKQTKYICIDCGQTHLYQDLVKELTTTINFKQKRYQHRCTICSGKKFRILSVVIES